MIFGRFWSILGSKNSHFSVFDPFSKKSRIFSKIFNFFFKKKKGSHNLKFKDSHFFRGVFLRNFRGGIFTDFYGNRNPGGDRDPAW